MAGAMNSFYGGQPGVSFEVKKIFHNFTELKEDLQARWKSPYGVGSIVVISYGLPGTAEEAENKASDLSLYGQNYNATFWQKIYLEPQDGLPEKEIGVFVAEDSRFGLGYKLITDSTIAYPEIEVFSKTIAPISEPSVEIEYDIQHDYVINIHDRYTYDTPSHNVHEVVTDFVGSVGKYKLDWKGQATDATGVWRFKQSESACGFYFQQSVAASSTAPIFSIIFKVPEDADVTAYKIAFETYQPIISESIVKPIDPTDPASSVERIPVFLYGTLIQCNESGTPTEGATSIDFDNVEIYQVSSKQQVYSTNLSSEGPVVLEQGKCYKLSMGAYELNGTTCVPVIKYKLTNNVWTTEPTEVYIDAIRFIGQSLNDPKITFELPAAVQFHYKSGLAKGQTPDETKTIQEEIPGARVGDIVISTDYSDLFVIQNIGAGSTTLKYKTCLFQLTVDSIGINPYVFDPETEKYINNKPTIDTSTTGKWVFGLPNAPWFTAEATTVAPGSSAAASFEIIEDGSTYKLSLDIPKGDKGDTGSLNIVGRISDGSSTSWSEIADRARDILVNYPVGEAYVVGYLSTDPYERTHFYFLTEYDIAINTDENMTVLTDEANKILIDNDTYYLAYIVGSAFSPQVSETYIQSSEEVKGVTYSVNYINEHLLDTKVFSNTLEITNWVTAENQSVTQIIELDLDYHFTGGGFHLTPPIIVCQDENYDSYSLITDAKASYNTTNKKLTITFEASKQPEQNINLVIMYIPSKS